MAEKRLASRVLAGGRPPGRAIGPCPAGLLADRPLGAAHAPRRCQQRRALFNVQLHVGPHVQRAREVHGRARIRVGVQVQVCVGVRGGRHKHAPASVCLCGGQCALYGSGIEGLAVAHGAVGADVKVGAAAAADEGEEERCEETAVRKRGHGEGAVLKRAAQWYRGVGDSLGARCVETGLRERSPGLREGEGEGEGEGGDGKRIDSVEAEGGGVRDERGLEQR